MGLTINKFKYEKIKFLPVKFYIINDNGIIFPNEINFRSTDPLGLQLVNNSS